MSPQDFIRNVFINELEKITKISAFNSFSSIATGIEFLGKCLDDTTTDWNHQYRSETNFNDAILKLDSLKFYRNFINKEEFYLYKTYRCGFAHSFVPRRYTNEKTGIIYSVGLCHGDGCERSGVVKKNENHFHLVLKIESLYEDFKNACFEIINMKFPDNSKMNIPFLSIGSPNNT